MKKLDKEDFEIKQEIKDLIGVISLPNDFDYKEFISEYLWEKYTQLENQNNNS